MVSSIGLAVTLVLTVGGVILFIILSTLAIGDPQEHFFGPH